MITKYLAILRSVGGDGIEAFSKCEIYVTEPDGFLNKTYCPFSWEYDRSELTLTIPSEFHWVCDRQKYTTYVFTAAWITGIFGTLVNGPAIDR